MIKSTVVTFALATFVASGALASSDKTYTLSKDKTVTSVSQPFVHYSPASAPPKGVSVIFGNVGTLYPKGLYFCCYGNTISGSGAGVGGAFAAALQFTPASNTKVTEIDAGVGYVEGTNSVVLSIYSDNGGAPGTLIASGTATGLGTFGDCCTLATAKIKKASLTGGTPYWVAVSATGTTWDAWTFNTTDEIDELTAAYSSDGGTTWSAGVALPAPSIQVLGK